VEDARAVLNGDADHLLGNDERLAFSDGMHYIDPEVSNVIAPQTTNAVVAPYPGDWHVTQYVTLPELQFQPQVPTAPIIPSVNNHIQNNPPTASRHCPYGCPNTFGRPGEYRRHMKKHNGPFFPCTHPCCGRMFYRQDKLRDHLSKGH
jgi:hypothetical protein